MNMFYFLSFSTFLLKLIIFGESYPLKDDSITVEYFQSKYVHSIVYVTCVEEESDYATHLSVKGFIDNGFSVGIFRINTNESFTIGQPRHKIGILFNLACPGSDRVLQQAEANDYFSVMYFWIIRAPALDNNTQKRFKNVFISPCSQVLVTYPSKDTRESTELKYIFKSAPHSDLRIENKSNMLQNEVIPSRNNLEGIYLRSAMVIAFPDAFTTLDDMKMRHIDTMARVNYPISSNLRQDLNFQFDMVQFDNFGWRHPNGSFDGLAGHFQHNEVDFAAIALFMRLDRLSVMDFAGETVRFRACIMFRQPPLSAVANIFALPFADEVWFSIFIFLIITAVAMAVLVLHTTIPINMNLLDCLNFVCGAICQQGFYVDVVVRSGRILVFSTFVTTLFLFTSFSANIVALLQSPSETIRTLDDLTLSPLEVGVQDTVYNKIYFKESTDPVTKLLYKKKIGPKGDAVFMRPEIGIRHMRQELFAYQVESQAAYKIISDTYSEPEKCGLKELEPFQLPPMSIPMRKNFPYKELFRQRLRWQRETGLIRREAIRWVHQRPQCESKLAGFISVGIMECRYALQMLAGGIICACIILILECAYKRIMKKYQLKVLLP